jgi:exonuclease V gamma subunit
MRAASSYILYSVFTHSIAAARLLFNLKRLPLLLSCGKSGAIMTNSVNDVKQAKAVQVVTDERACELLRNIRMDIQDFGGLREIKRITKNFAYSLSEAKPTDDAIPAVKVGKKCFYLFSVGQVNETNILNVIKSILKVEDAKRVFAKRLAKRLDFAAFCETKETVTRIECMKDGARLVGLELTDKQIKEAKHHLYNEYLQSLGLDE